MIERALNFSAGPAALPHPVLLTAQRDLVSIDGSGVGPLEISHRGPWFADVLAEAVANLGALLDIPGGHHVVFCQGGATQQFSMAPMNLLRADARADHVITGAWSAKALDEATKRGATRVAWTGEPGFTRVPVDEELEAAVDAEAAYVHITSNETIHGVGFRGDAPVPDTARLVADMSSDLCSRPVDVARYGLIYAGAQKNLGPAGVTVVIVREDVLSMIPDGLPAMLDYRTFVDHGSLYNTPPVFAIYVLMLVTRWLRDEVGGLAAQAEINRAKAGSIYAAIDDSDGYYRGHAEASSRSTMNATWHLPSAELDAAFVAEASERGMVGLKGHRSVGGIRASLYNAVPLEGAETLAEFMRAFAGRTD